MVNIIGRTLNNGRKFVDRVRLGHDYNFRAVAPLQRRSFSQMPGGEQFGYVISDGRISSDVYGILPGFFHSCFPRHFDISKRSSYIPERGKSNAWTNSMIIGDSVPHGHIIVFLDPKDNIRESVENLRSYNIHQSRLFVFVDTNGHFQPVDIRNGEIVNVPISETLPGNMKWLGERIAQHEQTMLASKLSACNDFHTLVVGCADKRKNTMFDRLFANEDGFQHLRFPGGFARPKGISATTDPIFASYKDKIVILISHTGCVAVKEVAKDIMGDPVIGRAKTVCNPTCNHVEDINSAASVISLENVRNHGITKIAMLQYNVDTGLLSSVDNTTGRPSQDQSLKELNAIGLGELAVRIIEYNQAVLNINQSKQASQTR